MAAPVVFDPLSRFLAGGFSELMYLNMPTAGQAFFGRPETGAYTIFSPDANDLDIEIERTDETLAALIPRGTLSRMIGSVHKDIQVGQGTAFSRKYPLTEEIGTITGDQLNHRLIPDEGPYERLTREQRMQRLAQKIYKIAIQRHIRLQEVLAWQSILLGVQSAQSVSDVTNIIYDWRRNSALTVSLTHGWGHASGVPLTDLDTMCDDVRFYSKRQPDMAIFGGTAMTMFLQNASVYTSYANKFYWDLIRFTSDFRPDAKFARFVAGGLVPFGVMRTPKGYSLTIFTYPEVYYNGSSSTKYFDDTKVLVCYSGARADRYFGPPERMPLTAQRQAELMERFGFNPATPPLPVGIEQADGVIVPQMFYVDGYEGEMNKTFSVRVQAAPIYAPVMTDAYAVAVAGVST